MNVKMQLEYCLLLTVKHENHQQGTFNTGAELAWLDKFKLSSLL